MVACFRKACLSATREECEEWLFKAGMLELNYCNQNCDEVEMITVYS